MFGEILKKYCPTCKEDVLAKEEREIIRKAQNEGKDVVVVMC
ncbi:hypothetical protein [Lysinibacillus sp. OL1]|nr:hypothetical protein [Lysinibacillus sp. OL1]